MASPARARPVCPVTGVQTPGPLVLVSLYSSPDMSGHSGEGDMTAALRAHTVCLAGGPDKRAQGKVERHVVFGLQVVQTISSPGAESGQPHLLGQGTRAGRPLCRPNGTAQGFSRTY